MCGDWIPVVTDSGTACVPPDQALLPIPEPFVPWTIPPTDPQIADEPWFHPPLALIDATSVHVLTPTADAVYDIEPWVLLNWFATDLRVAVDGTLVVQEGGLDPTSELEFWPQVAIHPSDAGPVDYIPDGVLRVFDVAVVDGVEVMFVTGYPLGPVDHISVLRLDDPTVELANLGLAGSVRWSVSAIDVVDEFAVVSGFFEGTEFLEYIDETGTPVDHPDPWAHIGPDDGIVARAATLSPDAARVTWAEGPESGRDDAWLVRSAAVATGDVWLEWDVFADVDPSLDRVVHSIHDVGSHLIVNRSVWDGSDSTVLPALVIALDFEEPGDHVLLHPGIVVPVPAAG